MWYDYHTSHRYVLPDPGIIGKYHVAPRNVYDFDYFRTSPLNQVGRNITHIKELLRGFLNEAKQTGK